MTIDTLEGKRVRWKWTEGPTAGMTHEHYFDPNGRVTFSTVEGPNKGQSGHADRYSAQRVSDSVYLVSYLGGSGYTLTVALNFENAALVGFASNDKNWHLVRGTFEVMP